MDNVLKGILIGAGVLLACFIVSKGFEAYQIASETNQIANENMNDYSKELAEYDLTRFDGLEVGGDDVVNILSKQLGDYSAGETAPIYINIITSKSNNVYVNGEHIAEIKNFTSLKYVKPISIFTGSIIRDKNNVIVGIKFSQK
jgi:hypothetical protein